MYLPKIQFAPLNIPLHRRLETLSVSIASFLIVGLPLASIVLTIYILFFTNYWWLMVPYIIWIAIDKAPGKGGRISLWLRSWPLLKNAKNYFPVNITLVPGFKLDPKSNYLCAWFPHGFLPIGVPVGLTNQFGKEFENHTMMTVTVDCNFLIPFSREAILALGACKASRESLSYLLSTPGGGKFVMLPVGGAAEAMNFKSGEYRITLKNRKGFIKLALRNGSPVVPVFSFGENNLWNQVIFPEGSLVRRFQLWLKRNANFTLLLFNGRGFFQYSFGILPFRRPVNVVVGMPLEFGKREDPTQEEIDAAHQKYIDALLSIFHEYKYRYEKEPENCQLILD